MIRAWYVQQQVKEIAEEMVSPTELYARVTVEETPTMERLIPMDTHEGPNIWMTTATKGKDQYYGNIVWKNIMEKNRILKCR